MIYLFMILSVLFGALYVAELVAYGIHNLEWLLLFMFCVVMERFEELKR